MNRIDPSYPEFVAEYELMCPIGGGATGDVFWGRHEHSGHAAAVKVMPAADRAGELEGDVLVHGVLPESGFEHVVRILQLGPERGCWYCVMELASHVDPWVQPNPEQYQPLTLAQKIASGPISVGEVVELARSLLSALEEFHRHSVSHGDVKPDNVFRFSSPGRWKLGDFDAARFMGRIDHSIGHEFFQLPDHPCNAQWDVGMCAKTLFVALTGSREPAAFEAFARMPPAAGGRGEGDRDNRAYDALRQVILRAWDTEPRRRFTSARHMREELERLLEPLEPPSPPHPWGNKGWLRIAAMLVATAALVFSVARFWSGRSLECTAVQFNEDGQIHLIVRNPGKDAVVISRITLIVEHERGGTRRGPMKSTPFEIPLEYVHENQSASLSVALEVKGGSHESLLIAPMTDRVLDVRVELTYDGGCVLKVGPVKLE